MDIRNEEGQYTAHQQYDTRDPEGSFAVTVQQESVDVGSENASNSSEHERNADRHSSIIVWMIFSVLSIDDRITGLPQISREQINCCCVDHVDVETSQYKYQVEPDRYRRDG